MGTELKDLQDKNRWLRHVRSYPPAKRCQYFGHKWVDARNEAVKSGLWCSRCGAIRAGIDPEDTTVPDKMRELIEETDLPVTGGFIPKGDTDG